MIDEQVGAEAFVEHQPVVLEAHGRLSLHVQTALFERACQHSLVRGVQQPRAEIAMDSNRGVDDRFGDGVEVSHGSAGRCSSSASSMRKVVLSRPTWRPRSSVRLIVPRTILLFAL